MTCFVCQTREPVATMQQTRPRILPPKLVCQPCLNDVLALRASFKRHGTIRTAAVLIWQLPTEAPAPAYSL